MLEKYKSANKKWNKLVTNNKILFIFPKNILIALISIILICVSFGSLVKNNYSTVFEQPKSTDVIEPLLVEPYSISLKNITPKKNADHVCLKFATYKRVNKSVYKFNIVNKDKIVYSEQFSTKHFQDNQFHCFNIKNVDYDQFSEYELSIVPVYADDLNVITLYKDGESNNATMRLIKYNGFFSFKVLMFIIIFIVFLIINYYINSKKIYASKFWLLLFPYVMFSLFLIPPYQVPDEQLHFLSSYNYTQYGDDFNNKIINVPSNISCLSYSHPQQGDKVTNFDDIGKCMENSNNENHFFKEISEIRPYGYVFSILGIWIADILFNRPLFIFYIGRFFNTIATFILIYFAIKKAPKYKNIILFVATIPMFIQQMTSYSYDSLLNGVSLLTFSLIVALLNNKSKVDKKLYILISLSIFFLFGIKIVYLPIVLLILTSGFKDNKQTLLYLAISFCVAFAIYKILNWLIPIGGTGELVNSESDTYSLFIKNPLSIIPLFFNSLVLKGWDYIEELYGYFGWFTYKFPVYIIIIYIIFTIYLLLSNNNKSLYSKRIVPILGLALSVAGIFGGMYICCTSVKLNYIDGVQGRYFIPLLAPLMVLLMPKKEKLKFDELIEYNFINIMLFYYLIFLLNVYF